MIYTVTFNPAIDYVAQLNGALQIGGLNRNRGEAVYFGGKGINVSVVLNELGIKNVALGFVAGFTGDGLEKGLNSAGVTTDFIRVAQGLTRINVKIKAQAETEINGIGPAITDGDMEKLHAQLDKLAAEDYLVLSGSIPACLGNDTYEQIIRRLADRGVSFVVDATGDLLRNVLKYKPFLVKPNHHELAELFGEPAQNVEQVSKLAKRLQQMGARNVLVSMAGDGAVLVDETGGTRAIKCPAGEVINSVGAGDSMVAGFLAGYLQTGDFAYALRLGTAAGSATAFSLGLADREAIMKLFGQL